jgi:hypothetical protein
VADRSTPVNIEDYMSEPEVIAKTRIEIKNRFDQSVIFACEATNMRETVLQAVGLKVSLCAADLRYSYLSSADLRSADLRYSDLRSAYLRYSYLRSADLRSADLRYSDLRSADLRSADLRYAKVQWNSHAMIAEILRQAAGDSVGRRKIAGLILVSPDWCWGKWLRLRNSRHFDWAFDTLAAFVQDGDGAPEALVQRAASLKAVSIPSTSTP